MKRHKTKYEGVYYREHKTRRHGVSFDRYYIIRLSVDGKRIEEACGWASEKWTAQKAANLRAELKENARRGEGPRTLREKRALEDEARRHKEVMAEEEARDGLTFAALFEVHYTPSSKPHKAEKTWEREEGLYTKWIKPVLGGLTLKEVAPFHIEKIKRDMDKAGAAPYSINRALGVVRAVFNWAIRRELFDGANPVSKVVIPRCDNRRLRFLTHEEADALLQRLNVTSPNVHDQALLSLHCGLRAGEVFNLTWADVNIEKGLLTLRDTKSGRTRPAFMTEAVKEMFRARKRGAPSELVFLDRNGKKIERISATFKRAVKALKLNEGVTDPRHKIVFHSLRHTFASWHVENGTDLYTLKELMGHSDVSMTARYAHLGQNTLRTATARLDAALARPVKVKEIEEGRA